MQQATKIKDNTTPIGRPTFHQHPDLCPLEQVMFADVLRVSDKGDLHQHAVVQKPSKKDFHIPPKTCSRIERIAVQLIFNKNKYSLIKS